MRNKIVMHQNQKLHRIPDIVKTFQGWKVGDWAICLHCGRAYKIGEYRLINGLQYCPYEGCSGDTVFDAIHYKFEGEPQRNKDYLNSNSEL